jgi:hypothetical protein
MSRFITINREGPLAEKLKDAMVSGRKIFVNGEYVLVLSREMINEGPVLTMKFNLEVCPIPIVPEIWNTVEGFASASG